MREALGLGKIKAVYDRVAGRYDRQHRLLTGGSDQRGRRLLVDHAVHSGDRILDCGAGTGSTTLLALNKAGPSGRVNLFDISDGMLAVARQRIESAGFENRAEFNSGDMTTLPFDDNSFDVALSTYSICPLYDPAAGAKELYRVTRPGGRIGIAHSTEPRNRLVKWVADRVEDVAWHMPSISLGCRSVTVLPTLERLGCKRLYQKRIGVPLWPFLVFVVEKPE
jgi:demethylmenaquinone methyltransferase/2-methoxy-6-polyprenyl-1,4-benzoquinol methylase